MVPSTYKMVDLGGIDLAEVNGSVVPGIYNKVSSAINSCRIAIFCNWKFADIVIAPAHVLISVDETGGFLVNDLIAISQDDTVKLIGVVPEPVLQELSATENGEYLPPEGVDGFSPVNVDVQPALEELSVTENGVYTPPTGADGFSEVTVNVDDTTQYDNGFFPIISFSPKGVYYSVNSSFNIISEGILTRKSIGHKILIIGARTMSSYNDESKDYTADGMTLVKRQGGIKVMKGILTPDLTITTVLETFFFIAEISDNYDAVPYNNLCYNKIGSANSDTSYLKTADAFKISAALPSEYGIFIGTTNFDYSEAQWQPSAWYPLRRNITKDEIMFTNRLGKYFGSGYFFSVKRMKDAYNQYYLKGSINGYTSDTTLTSASSLTAIDTKEKFKNVPTWNNVYLSMAFISLISLN